MVGVAIGWRSRCSARQAHSEMLLGDGPRKMIIHCIYSCHMLKVTDASCMHPAPKTATPVFRARNVAFSRAQAHNASYQTSDDYSYIGAFTSKYNRSSRYVHHAYSAVSWAAKNLPFIRWLVTFLRQNSISSLLEVTWPSGSRWVEWPSLDYCHDVGDGRGKQQLSLLHW